MAWHCKNGRCACLGQLQSKVREYFEKLKNKNIGLFRAESLVHSVAVVSSSCLVYSASLAPAVSQVFATLLNGSKAFPTYCTGASGLEDGAVSGVPGSVNLDRERELQPKSSVPQVR